MANIFTKTLRQYVPELRGQDITPTSIISGGISGGADALSGIFDSGFNLLGEGMGLNIIVGGGQNIFSTTSDYVNKFNTGLGEELHTMGESFDIGWRMEDGFLGTGNFSYDSSWWAKPNIEQFHSGKLAENMGWLGDKLSGKGYLHDQVQWKLGYVGEKVGELVDFVKNPADKMLRDGESSQSSVTTSTTRKRFRSVGTLKGKTPYLHLNVTAKGMGRKSLRIGEEGMGDTKSGKYRTYRSGRRTSTSKATY